MQCPCCGRKRGIKSIGTGFVLECPKCKALFSNTIYLGDSYKYVLLYWDTEDHPKTIRYFDFRCLSSKGIVRRHGWFNPKTRRIVQTG